MRHNYPYLKDASFLLELHKKRIIELLVKIIILDFNEKPIKEIQGQITSGSINVDGKSAVRRTANLSAFIENQEANPMEIGGLFALNRKVKIEIGIINNSKQYLDYPILWFPQGLYVIMSASSSSSATGTTINLQLKDKMVFLNGECGGVIPASIDFQKYDTVDVTTGNFYKEKPTIIQIIQELVNHFGGEQLGKIIIGDIDSKIKEVVRWLGEESLYLHIFEKDTKIFSLDPLTDDEVSSEEDRENRTFNTGEDIGYIYTDFYYPDELVANAGDSVCTILDKIKNRLGNFEYFYDLDGNFIFQEIKNYLNTSESTLALNSIDPANYLVDRTKGKAVYSFEDGHIITSYSNSPQYNNIKNDFIIWGNRKVGEKSYPIRYHLVLDKKPKIGNSYYCYFYPNPEDINLNLSEDAILELAKLPIEYDSIEDFPVVGEITHIYSVEDKAYYWDIKTQKYVLIKEPLQKITTEDWRTELYLSGTNTTRFAIDSNPYYVELVNEWPKLYDIREGKWKIKSIYDDIDYYLDFIDTTAAISEFSVSNIGRRTHVVVDDKINCLFEPPIPENIIIPKSATDEDIKVALDRGADPIQISTELYENVAIGGVKNSAFNLVKDLLYQYTGYNEAIVLQILPMYFLEPNIRIAARNKDTGIYGEYMLNSFSIPLDINGTMSLSCTRALERV